ncbi:hypothetical protein ENBRE01_1750 [Enteropsectra breve]|nr:hypothetical protein ENBRE01_1750 [Enteropsectra breve]
MQGSGEETFGNAQAGRAKQENHSLNFSDASMFSGLPPAMHGKLNSAEKDRDTISSEKLMKESSSPLNEIANQLKLLTINNESVEFTSKGEVSGLKMRIEKLKSVSLQDPIEWGETLKEIFVMCEYHTPVGI